MNSLLSGIFLCGGNAVGEALELIAVEDLGIDQADEEGFDRAFAEPVDDALDGAAGDTLAGQSGAIDEGAIVDAVGEVALFFETAQHGADSRVFEGPVEFFTNLFGRDGAETPDDEEDVSLQVAELGGIVTGLSATVHNVTDCNTWRGAAQEDLEVGVFLRGMVGSGPGVMVESRRIYEDFR